MLMISHLPLLSVFIPAKAFRFIEILYQGIRFDYWDVQEYIDIVANIQHSEEDVELPDNFVQLGYESGYMPENLGTLFFIIMAQIFTIMTFFLL